jgi:hypothetical protein
MNCGFSTRRFKTDLTEAGILSGAGFELHPARIIKRKNTIYFFIIFIFNNLFS